MTKQNGMALALQQAQLAAENGEVPVGAVLLDSNGNVLAQAGNRVEELRDPSAMLKCWSCVKPCSSGRAKSWRIALYLSHLNLARCVRRLWHIFGWGGWCLARMTPKAAVWSMVRVCLIGLKPCIVWKL